MNTVAGIRAYLDFFDDEQVMVFALIHKDDRKYLKRSIDNNVAVFLQHPVIKLQAIAGGTGGELKNPVWTIFLINDER